MKKLLALVLALVMVLSLCVTSNAAYDGEEFDYDDAVEVMSAIGVFQGDENGKFNPKDVLTREQAAKIVTYMLLGKKAADALVTIAAPFADVEATRWSAGSIAYCYNEGILAGVGNGMFAPTSELTGLAFAKMMLTALGYSAENEGLTGSNWSINAAKLALTVGLTDDMGDIALAAPMTREQAAKMALNTLEATMVEYPNASIVKVGDVEVTTSAKASEVKRSSTATDYRGGAEGTNGTQQFCEKYFKNLKATYSTNDLGRPAVTWKYKNDKVGTFTTKTPVVTYTADTKLAVVKADLKDYDYADGLRATLNGDTNIAVADYNDVKSLTNDGKVVEVYVTDGVVTYVAVIDTGVAEVTSVNNTKKTFTISYHGGKTLVVDADSDFYGLYGKVEKNDILAVVYNDANDVLDLYVPELVKGTISYVNSTASSNANSQAKVNGTTYKAYGKDTKFSGTLNQDSKLYLSKEGYVIYVKAVSSDANYIFVTNYWQEKTNSYNGTTPTIKWYVKGVLADGTIVDKMQVANVAAATTGTAVDATNFGDLKYGTAEKTAVIFGADGDTTTEILTKFDTAVFAYKESTVKGNLFVLTKAVEGTTSAEGTYTASTKLEKTANTIHSVHMTPDVQFIYVSGTGDDVKVSVGAKASITAGTAYTAVIEKVSGTNRVTTVFVSSANINADDTVYVAEILGTVKYTDADGVKKTGYQAKYFAKGATEATDIVLTNNDETGFVTLTSDGDAFTAAGYGTEGNDKQTDKAVTSMYNGYALVNGVTFDLNGIAVVDYSGNDIDTAETLEAFVNADDQQVKVSVLYNKNDSNKVEKIYVQSVKSTDAGLKSVTINGTVADIQASAAASAPVDVAAGARLTVALELSDSTASYEIEYDADTTSETYGSFTNGTSTATAGKTGALKIVVKAKATNTETYYVSFKSAAAPT